MTPTLASVRAVAAALLTAISPVQAQDISFASASSVLVPREIEAVGVLGRMRSGLEEALCPAVLIAPAEVLATARCLADREGGARLQASDIRFHLADHGARLGAVRAVRAITWTEGYDPATWPSYLAVRTNLVTLHLDRPVSMPARDLRLASRDLDGADRLVVVDPFQPANAICQPRDSDADLLAMNCPDGPPAPGAVVFVERQTRLDLLGLVSTTGNWGQAPVSLVVLAEGAPTGKALAPGASGGDRGETGTIRFQRPEK